MKTVGVRTLKNRLSEYLRLVQNGERVTVTNRGVAIARLTPAGSAGETAEEALERLAREGRVRLGDPNAKKGYTRPRKEAQIPHDELMAGLDWLRGGR